MQLPSAEKIHKHLTRMHAAALRELENAEKNDKELRMLISGKLAAFEEIAVWFNHQEKR